MRRFLVPLLVVLATAVLVPVAGAEPTATSVPGISEAGEAIARGPGGTMWIAQPKAPGRITRIIADGTRTDFTGGVTPNFPANRKPSGVVALDDGSVWFLLNGGSEQLGRITSTGEVTRHRLSQGKPTSLTAGPDGALWMTADGGGDDDDDRRDGSRDAIVRYAPGQPTTRFDDGLGPSTNPHSLVAGADGALWFAESGGQGRVGRMTTDGALSWHAAAGQGPLTTLAPGPLASVWYARSDTVGPLADVGIVPFATFADPAALALGPDGALWAAEDHAVARAQPGEAVTRHAGGLPAHAKGQGLTAGADGRMWMTLTRAPYLVRITVPPLVDAAQATATTVRAGVRPNGLATTVYAELSGPQGTWQRVGEADAGAGTETTPVTFELTNQSPGTTYRARLVATNEAGTSVGAEASLRTSDAPAPMPAPPVNPPVMPQPPPGPAAVVLPVKGETLLAAATTGSVRVKAPGQTSFTELGGIGSLPPGTVIDAAAGRVLLATGHERTGVQFGLFTGGRFRMQQSKRGVGRVDLTLTGRLDCDSDRFLAATSRKRRKSRKIWGLDDGGSFTTRGRDSVATVRGTLWSTEDTCRGTRVEVFDGAVSVRPTAGGRARLLQAGEAMLTPRRR